jgi:protein-S-isoprenylcysteine O-methyltransferase Ste14
MNSVTVVRWLTLFIWLLWLVIYWRGGAGLLQGLLRAFRRQVSSLDGLLILGIILLSNALLWTGYFITRGHISAALPDHAAPLSAGGALLVAVGSVGTIYCRRQLGGLWNAETVLLANHRLVDRGAYQVVRHPIYAFACLMGLGTILVFPTWWNVLAGSAMVGLYVAKSLHEEHILAAGLGGYREYQERVRYRFAPYIW